MSSFHIFGCLCWQKVEREILVEVGMPCQRRQRFFLCIVAIHQHKRQPGAGRLAQVHDLVDDDVEKGEAVLHNQQRFRAVHAHARPQPAVELEHNRTLE